MNTTSDLTLENAIDAHIAKGWLLINETRKQAVMTAPKKFDWVIFGSTIAIGLLTFGTGLFLTAAYFIWFVVSPAKQIVLSVRDGEMLVSFWCKRRTVAH